MPSLRPWKDWGEPSSADHDGPLLVLQRIGVAHDERVRRHLADEPLGDRAQLAVLHRAHAQRAHDHQVVGRGPHVVDQRLVVLAVDHLALEGQPGRLGLLAHHVEVGVGDELEPHGDQRVVDLALPLELVLVLVLLGQRVLHLLEPVVVQSGGVHVASVSRARNAWPSSTARSMARFECSELSTGTRMFA